MLLLYSVPEALFLQVSDKDLIEELTSAADKVSAFFRSEAPLQYFHIFTF